MKRAIIAAELGDDVYGEDPTVNLLQTHAAHLLGKEAALFVPSGTMANQIAIRTHTEPGDEIIVESSAHIFLYEAGGFAALSGVSARCVEGERGLLRATDISTAVRPPGGMSHYPRSRLVCLENTANRAGGTLYHPSRINAIATEARKHDLRLHLDGARLFNAAVALKATPATLAAPFDSIAFCLSKGLGCPIGSLLVGSQLFIDRAHRFRKMFGGGMRQAGMLAAAGLHALEHHIDRLADDHTRAQKLATTINNMSGATVDLSTVESNMAYIDVSPSNQTADLVCHRLADHNVLASPVSASHLRVVTHLDIDDAAINTTLQAFTAIVG